MGQESEKAAVARRLRPLVAEASCAGSFSSIRCAIRICIGAKKQSVERVMVLARVSVKAQENPKDILVCLDLRASYKHRLQNYSVHQAIWQAPEEQFSCTNMAIKSLIETSYQFACNHLRGKPGATKASGGGAGWTHGESHRFFTGGTAASSRFFKNFRRP